MLVTSLCFYQLRTQDSEQVFKEIVRIVYIKFGMMRELKRAQMAGRNSCNAVLEVLLGFRNNVIRLPR